MAVLSDFDEYLESQGDSLEVQAEERSARNARLLRFPHAVMLQVAFAEMDFANRWCWTQFGPADGQCTQKQSDYRVCQVEEPHSHSGIWTDYWFAKTDYDFGFNEWYFAEKAQHDLFVEFVPQINWGEKYPA